MTNWLIIIYLTICIITLTKGRRENRLVSPYTEELYSCAESNELCRSLLLDKSADFDEDIEMVSSPDKKIRKDNHVKDIFGTFKRGNNVISGCDCQVKTRLVDLGHSHFPRYLFSAVCENDDEFIEMHDSVPKCWRGSRCKPIDYKVRVLTYRTESDSIESDHMAPLLPDELRSDWKFKTINVAAGCLCSF